MALGDVLQRFRRIWSPPGGPAGTAGVPVDQRQEITGELAGVMAALDEIERDAAAVGEQARRRAAEIEARAAETVEAILAEGRAEAERQRLAAALATREAARQEGDRAIEEARREAARIARVAPARERRLVAEVVREIAALAAQPGAGGRRRAAVVDRR